MWKYLAFVFLLAVGSLTAQVSSSGVQYVSVAPSGACRAGAKIQQVVTGAGGTYTCQSISGGNGTWTVLSSSSASGTVTSATIAGTSGQLNVAGTCTITTTGTCTISIPSSFYTNASFFPFQSITTTGTSGAATLSAGVLNIPNYTYTLPAATSSALGGVKPDGTTISNSSGAISVNYTSTTYFPFQSLTTTGSTCTSATLASGVLNIPPCSGGGGSLPSGTQGLTLRNTTGSTTYAAASLAGGIDASVFLTGSAGTCTPGTNDNICIANAIASISGTPGSGGGFATIDDTNVTGPQIWTASPFAALLSNGTTNFTGPQKCGKLLLNAGSQINMNQPLVRPPCWDVEFVGLRGAVQNIQASSTWPGIYTTGTVTTAAATTISGGQYQFVVTGSGTTFTSNVVVGEEFGICQGTNNPGANGPSCGGNGTTTCSVACGTNAAGQLTYGVVLAVTDNTHLVIGTNATSQAATNASGVNYVIKAPLTWIGDMGASGGDGGGVSGHWKGGTLSCNAKPGCSALANFSEQENSKVENVVINHVIDTFVDIEGVSSVNSGPYDLFVMNSDSSCVAATTAVINRNNSSPTRAFEHFTVNFDNCPSTGGAVAMDWESPSELWDGHYENTGNTTGTNVFVDVGDNSGSGAGSVLYTCPVYCPVPVNNASGSNIHGIGVTGAGGTGVNLGSAEFTQIQTSDLTVNFTNTLVDNARSCTIVSSGGDSNISRYDHLYGNGFFGTAQNSANACGSGGTFTGTISPNIMNATTGFQIGGAAPNTHCLVGNGTHYVDNTCPSGGPGTGTQYDPAGWATTSTLGSIAPTSGYDAVPQVQTATTTSGAFTALPSFVPPGVVPNAQTGTTYTYLLTDRMEYVSFSNASSIAVTL
ncbi:MAG: hypothetical protein WCA20_11270, partial [Candidatus Sulfotelmatobacter sp.]